MKIPVVQSDIDRGIPQEADSCPVALAIAESMPDAWNIEVLEYNVSWNVDGLETDEFISYDYSHDAKTWIEEFDSGAPVSPTTVNLLLMDITLY